MTTEKFKKDKPDIDVFDSDTNKVEVPTGPLQSTMQTADERERRHLSSLKPANAESPSVFDQSDASDLHRHLTPESAGVVIKKRSGPANFEETRQ